MVFGSFFAILILVYLFVSMVVPKKIPLLPNPKLQHSALIKTNHTAVVHIAQGAILFLMAFIWLGPCLWQSDLTWSTLFSCALRQPIAQQGTAMPRLTEDSERTKQIDVQQMINDRLSTLSVQPSVGIETRYPAWFQPDRWQTHTGLAYWLAILPFAENKTEAMYLVIPRYGLIMPIHRANEVDEARMIAGKSANYQQYLAQWALWHPGTPAPFTTTGNRVIAGHTSYFTNKPGNYKTTFQVLPLMLTGDQMRVYMRTDTGRTRYVYGTKKSFLTVPTDRSILASDPTSMQLTLYGCYPFGSLAKRWIVQGDLLWVDIQPL